MSFPINPYILANSQGIPRLQATSVTVNATEVRFSFQNHRFLNAPFVGLILFKLPSIPTGTTATLPVTFATNGNTQRAINYETGAPLTVAEVTRPGIFLAIYDSEDGVLYVFPTTAAPAA
jgi:Ca2+/H+ antiporter